MPSPGELVPLVVAALFLVVMAAVFYRSATAS